MSGPIIRSKASTKYSMNWESVFAPKKARPKKTVTAPASKPPARKKSKG